MTSKIRKAFLVALLSLEVLSRAAHCAEPGNDSSESGPFTAEQSCFSGTFSSYDTWVQSIKSTMPEFDPKSASFPSRSVFEEYLREMDCKWILYPSLDNQLVNGFVILPKKYRGTNARLPIVIYNRGGSGVAQTPVVMGSLIARFFPLAKEGFVVAGSQYRGLRSRLLGPARDPGHDEFGGADVGDVKALLDIVSTMPNADATKIGLYGWSRGGMQSFLVAKDDERIKAIVVGGALTDLEDWKVFRPDIEGLYDALIPKIDSREIQLSVRSAIRWAEELPKTAPILLMHGMSDDRVPYRQSVAMSLRLHELGRDHELVLIGGGDHGLTKHSEHVEDMTLAWFKRHLN